MEANQYFDVVWIGTGQATMAVVPKLAEAGQRVAVVESGTFGGTCVNTGYTPTKTLVASAFAMHTARRGDDFGFSIHGLDVDFPAVMAAQRRGRAETSRDIESRLTTLTRGAVFRGHPRFIGAHEVVVNGTRITGDTIVIHTGTRPVAPSVEGVNSVPWLTNESLLDLDTLPQHLIVVGGSYIALEFGQMFRRFGSEVTVLERGPRLVAREDKDISELVAKRLSEEAIRLNFDCTITGISPANGVTVKYQQAGEALDVAGSHVLFAVGRQANSDDLDLEAAGVEVDERGYVPVNDVTQTSTPHIYAIGDINGRGAYTHTSVHDGEIFWDHYRRQRGLHDEAPKWDRTLSARTAIYSMFIDPPLARLGMNETEARRSGRNVLMATMPMAHIARAREKRETHGLVKILVDADTEAVLGATIFGTSGDEVIGALATLVHARASYKLFRRVVFPHPTVAELMPCVLDRLQPLEPMPQ